MSDVSQGPGWWSASDGRWYPPEQHPNYTTPPPPSPYAVPGRYATPATGPHGQGPDAPGPPGYGPPGYGPPAYGPPGYGPSPYGPSVYGPSAQGPPRTNGKAVASLVCSVVGILLAGIPAIVGIILGFVARAEIRESKGAQTGAGLALGGIIVGFAEIALAIVVVVALVGFVETELRQDQIAGAPGYTTIDVPIGKPLAEGRPWGESCRPIVFEAATSVPNSVYTQLENVVLTARIAGVDVTLATRADRWYPTALYPAGLTNRSVQFVSVFATQQPPPQLSNARAEHIVFEWNTRPNADASRQYLTYLQAEFYLQALSGPATDRLAARQLVAFSQGVAASTAPGSGIVDGSTADRFSSRDISAMALMSGCHPPS